MDSHLVERLRSGFTSSFHFRCLVLFVLMANVLSVLYVLGGGGGGGEEGRDGGEGGRERVMAKRSSYFDKEARGTKLIHFVREKSWDWTGQREFSAEAGFDSCPNYRNCRMRTHLVDEQTKPVQLPNAGSLVIFTAQALRLHPISSFWSEAASLRRDPSWPLWAVLAMRSPFELNLDFLTFRNFGFNLTMSYKPDADVFVPYNFWQDNDDGRPSPRVTAGKTAAAVGAARNKTRKVLWLIDGPCKSINNRMKYALELSRHIPVDIIGHCETEEEGPGGRTTARRRIVDYSTHPADGHRRGVVTDYKFALAFEDISCRDYVTDAFFDVAKTGEVVPIVMGAQKEAYELLAPAGSFLHIDDFPGGPTQLAERLHQVDGDDATYARFFRHIDTGRYAGAPVSALCRLCDVVNFLSDASSSGALSSSPFFHSPDDFGEYWTPDDCNTNSLYQTNVGDSEDAIKDDTYHVYAPPANEL